MFEQTIINKLQDHFGITSNGLREQLEREVYDELAKVRANLEKDVEYRKKILSDANFAKLEQARLTNELAEKFFKVLSPTLDLHEGPLGRIPLIINEDYLN